MSDQKNVVEEKINLEPLLQPAPEAPTEPVRHDVHFKFGDVVRLAPGSTAASLAEFYGDFNRFRVCAYSAFGPKADQVSYEIVHLDPSKLKEARINVMASELEKIES